MVNPRDIAGECRKRKRMVNPRDIAGNRRRRRRRYDCFYGPVVRHFMESGRSRGPSPVESYY